MDALASAGTCGMLSDMGFEIDPQQLSDPSSRLLKAIISLGFCSGSFVSPSGLIFTNHHCATMALSYLSNQDSAEGHTVSLFPG